MIGFGTYKRTKEDIVNAYEAGYKIFDTAELYKNEKDVSDLNDPSLFIITKIKIYKNQNITMDKLEESFYERLKIFKKIDILLLHHPTSTIIWNHFVNLYKKNKDRIGYIGCSNYDIDDLKKIDKTFCSYNEIELSPFYQRKELLEYCKIHNIKIIAHSCMTRSVKFPEIKDHSNSLSKAQQCILWASKKSDIVLVSSSEKEHIIDNIRDIPKDEPIDFSYIDHEFHYF